MKRPNTRWACPHCGAEGWDDAGNRVSGRYDHDRPNGGKCRKAESEAFDIAATTLAARKEK